jgi:integrase/recombinase XerD
MEDIKLDAGILIVPKGKGNKRRVVPMSPGVRSDLKKYIENERDLYVKDECQKALLLNIKGDILRKYTCRKILKKIIVRTANQTIIEKNISIHNLRHSIATHLLEKGVPIEQVRNFLGHSHLETTEIYTRVNHEQLKELIL